MRSVLLVEDNSADEKLALLAMKRAALSAEIAVARDGQEALDYLFATGDHVDRAGRGLPSLVLLDLNLPRLDGLEVLRRLRADERTRRLPVVMLSTSSEARDVQRACDLGANAFVRKAVGFDEFASAMNTLLVFWLVLHEASRPAAAG